MTEFISNLIGNEYWATIVMSLVPLIELKGGIVYAQSAGINEFLSLLLAWIGSTIVFIPIFWLLRPILNLLKKIKFIDKLALKLEGYFEKKSSEALEKEQSKHKKQRSVDFIKALSVFIFVAIPLPMTGVWTGTAIAVFLNLKFKKSILPITLGNLVAGLLILLLSVICKAININLDYVLYGLFILAVILFFVFLFKVILTKEKKTEN
ncbi:MAG: small multi-drug export protein [Clostridia bacterium]|nr:small multi-drug export protein [Clostridia bacterium]